MKKLKKEDFLYLIFLVVIGIAGGIFTAGYTLEITDPEIMAEALSEMGGKVGYVVIGTLQVVSYALIFGLLGKLLAKKIGLWKDIRFEKNTALKTTIVGGIAGGAIMLIDVLVFSHGAAPEEIKESILSSLSLNSMAASFTYGGIIEELMMRLFLMSLIVLLLWKLFYRSKDEAPEVVLVISNLAVAILFAASHLPATASTVGLTPMLVLRCFLLNGSMGIVFGRAYRKHGIHYAMLSHIFAHVGMKLFGLVLLFAM